MKHTAAQQQAIEAKGNVLVVAGAGTGKTRTLIDRCMRQLLDTTAPISLLEILMVTFTEAAASEMRGRIAQRLEEALLQDPQNPDLQEKLAQIDAASIGTLHSFCFNLIRQHFHSLELDPQARVLEPEEIAFLEEQTLDELLERHYEGKEALDESVRRYVTEFENGWDRGLREWIIRLHRFSQAMVAPHHWISEQIRLMVHESPDQWRSCFLNETLEWMQQWIPVLQTLPDDNTNAKACLELMLPCTQATPNLEAISQCIRSVADRDQNEFWPPRCKTKHREPIKRMLDDAAFLATLCKDDETTSDPLEEDWKWFRSGTLVLLELTREFTTDFASKKRERGGLDFSDLEQFSLDLLWDRNLNQPTELARSIHEQFKQVYVDEYQDINAAQDCILTAIAGEGAQANRFLVGDVKQSIYGFRLANPRFFIDYERDWRTPKESEPCQVVYLQDNFRSRPGILNFVNAFFSHLMRSDEGGIAYDANAHLQFGDPDNRSSLTTKDEPSVECRLIMTVKPEDPSGDQTEPPLSETEQEARMIAERLLQLKEDQHPVYDHAKDKFRPVEWKDMAILMRSVRSRADTYVRVFGHLNIPLSVPRSGMLERTEITDLVSLLTLLDNPRQDIPLIAVLRSPLVGLNDNELSLIRIGSRRGSFWSALHQFTRESPESILPIHLIDHSLIPSALKKTKHFLEQFYRWRQSGRHLNLSRRLEAILNDTFYLEHLASTQNHIEAITHVKQLIQLARQFDQYQQQGLNRFLQYLENKRNLEAEFDPGLGEEGQAVSLMSIHKSKGLEFPIVAVAGLAGTFNFQDIQQTWLLDETLGVAGMIQPPGAKPRYPSLPLWIGRRRRKAESLREEMRLLYVAFTRARDHLILAGTASENRMQKWTERSLSDTASDAPSSTRCAMDWLFPWLCQQLKHPEWWSEPKGKGEYLQWHVIVPEDQHDRTDPPDQTDPTAPTAAQLPQWQHMASWNYPYQGATHHPAKATVTMLRRHRDESTADESASWFFQEPKATTSRSLGKPGNLSASERGTMHHHFLQWLALQPDMSMEHLERQREDMILSGNLDPVAEEALDLQAIHHFWQGAAGKTILNHIDLVQREMPFTARFKLSELAALGLSPEDAASTEDDFVIVQGIVDLCILDEQSIQILDYKTDNIQEEAVSTRLNHYQVQLELYAQALQRIYQRPVTRKWLHFLSLNKTIEL
jgi:ATP-dependent helicase/nuclease subunit A